MRAVAILIGFVVALASSPIAAAERVALVVGNSQYVHTSPLRNPRNDAEDVSATLRRLGFEVIEAYDLTGEAFADTIGRFANQLTGAKVALFYYSGHAMQHEEVNYLMPVDAKLKSAFQLKREMIALSDIVDQMESRAAVNLVFLDACRNNPLAEELTRSLIAQGRAVALARGLARETGRGTNTLLTFAAGPGRLALDGRGRNSPFTEALLKHIETPGLEVEIMLKRVSSDVLKVTENFQEPERLSRLKIEFYFKPDDQVAAVEDKPKPDNPFTPDALHWSLVKDTTNAALLREFISRYPSSPFRGDAELRLKALEKPAVPQATPEQTMAYLTTVLPTVAGERYAHGLSQPLRQKVAEALRREGVLGEAVDDFVRSGADSFALRFAVIKYQQAQGFPQTGYLLREQVARLLAGDGEIALAALSPDQPSPLFEQQVPAAERAREEFQRMSLSRIERLRIARALESMGLLSGPFPAGFVESGETDSAFTEAVSQFQRGRGYEVTGYPSADQVRYLVSLGDKPSSWERAQDASESEQNFRLGGLTPEQAIARAKLALNDTAEGDGWRSKLKDFQRRVGFDPTGVLNEAIFPRLLDEFVNLPHPNWTPDEQFKNWSYWQQRDGERRCYIWTFSTGVTGRYGYVEAPDLTLSRVPTWPDRHLSATFGRIEWFDTTRPTRIVIDGRSFDLSIRENYFWPAVTGNNEYSDEITQALAKATESVTIIGTSPFGGDLRIAFSPIGFTAAFRRMDERCGRNTLVEWLQ